MMLGIRKLRVEYGHCTRIVKQTYEIVLNNDGKVINGLWVSPAIPYTAVRIMEDIGSCDGGNINGQPSSN